MHQFPILVCLIYYDRPNLVQRSIYSLFNQTHNNFHIAGIDDSSKIPLKDVVNNIQTDSHFKNKFTFYRGDRLDDDDKINHGSQLGNLINKAMLDFPNHIIVTLCDDDMLTLDYLSNLSSFYSNNININHSYCKYGLYDVKSMSAKQALLSVKANSNISSNPSCGVQFSWKIHKDILCPENLFRNLDVLIRKNISNIYGNWSPNNIFVQIKGDHSRNVGKILDDQEIIINPGDLNEPWLE